MSYVLRYVSNEGHVYKLNCWITQISKNASNSPADTFISVLPTVVEDLSGNPVIPIPLTNAVGAGVVIGDTSLPAVASFSLDLDNGTLIPYFTGQKKNGQSQ